MTTLTAPRSHVRPIGILAAAVAIVVGSYLVSRLSATPLAQPLGPAASAPVVAVPDPGGVDASLADSDLAAIDRQIGVWTANLRRSEHDFIAATNLARLYHARGRLTADLGAYVQALTAAGVALEHNPTDADARGLAATIRFSLHDFAGALSTADALLRDDPRQIGALATTADALQELGRLQEADARYTRLAALASGPAVDARLARHAYVEGRPAEAMSLALKARRAALGDPALRDAGFYQGMVGEIARLTGDPGLARSAFTAALAVRGADLAALVGLARIDAFDGATADAISRLEQAAAIAPQPETLALLSDLQAARGDDPGATATRATLDAIRRLGDATGAVYDRVLLRFDLDHITAVSDVDGLVASARTGLAARSDSSGHDLLAWALHRAGDDAEAAIESQAALGSGIVDARMQFHAGAIALANGDEATGREHLAKALALGPALDPIERTEALALLGG